MSDIPMYLRDIPKAKRAIKHIEQDLARLRDAATHIAVREGELKMVQGHLAELEAITAKEPKNGR
jgi:hypothetical protein